MRELSLFLKQFSKTCSIGNVAPIQRANFYSKTIKCSHDDRNSEQNMHNIRILVKESLFDTNLILSPQPSLMGLIAFNNSLDLSLDLQRF